MLPHIYPELIFFILVSTVPAAIFYRATEIRAINVSTLLIACGCVFLSLSWSVDYSLHMLLDRGTVPMERISTPHLLLVLFGFVPGAGLVGFGFANWARETASLRHEMDRRREMEGELQQLSAKLEQEAARAERADKAKADFLANMSHDLRTPLNAIIGFSEMMHAEIFGKLGTARYKEYLSAINASSRQLHDSISDMLDLAKINDGQMKLVRQKLNLTQLANECLAIVEDEAHNKHITLDINIAAELDVSADKRMLVQVLLNLLGNAIKFTPPHGKVSLTVLQQTDGKPVILLRDTGYGISSEDIKLATAPFDHTESLLARSHEGLALQLALVNQFIELHDGQLMIDSKPDYGTCVTIKLPAVPLINTYSDDNVVSIA